MIITNTQLDVFSQISVDLFVSKSVLFLKSNFPHKAEELKDDMMINLIKKTISFGQRFEIKSERNFQKLMFFEVSFDMMGRNMPLAENILSNTVVSEKQRIKQLYTALMAKM